MGYIATSLAKIPSSGYEWYIFLLEDGWTDSLRRELSDNFQNLAEEVGSEVLVIRGAERILDDVLRVYALCEQGYDVSRFPFPGLLIVDTPPAVVMKDKERSKTAKMILLPLSSRYLRPGSITDVLKEIVNALKDPDALHSLQALDSSQIERRWGWITRYFKIKPIFFGFEIDLNRVIEDMFRKKKSR